MVSMDKGTIEKVIEALRKYYSKFGTKNSLTIHEAAHIAGVPSVAVHSYMATHKGVGMPENMREAYQYLRNLNSYKSA